MNRSFARRSAKSIGNFWVDLTRCTLYVLLPISVVVGLFFVSQGVPQNLNAYVDATTIEGADLHAIAEEALVRHARAYGDNPIYREMLDVGGDYAFRLRGEAHARLHTPSVVTLSSLEYDRYRRKLPAPTQSPVDLKGALTSQWRIPDLVVSIWRRFCEVAQVTTRALVASQHQSFCMALNAPSTASS